MHPCIADPSLVAQTLTAPLLPGARSSQAVCAACLLLPALLLLAPGALARSTDRNQKTNVSAGSSDCSLASETAPCLLVGNVVINQGTLEIRADRADLRRKDGEISTVKLNGAPVHMKQQGDDGGWMNAAARQVDYDLAADTVVLTGAASIQQPGRGSIQGERIVYNTTTGQVQSGGPNGGGGRVNMVFEPKNPPAKAPPAPAKPATAPVPGTTKPATPPAPAPTPVPKGTP